MRCSVFIATSLDGYIATEDGRVDWLDAVGNLELNHWLTKFHYAMPDNPSNRDGSGTRLVD